MKHFYSFLLLFALSSFLVVTAQDYGGSNLQSIDDTFSKLQKLPNVNYSLMNSYPGFREVLRGDELGLNSGKEIVLTNKNVEMIEVLSCSNLGNCVLADEFRKMIQEGDYVPVFETTNNCNTKIYMNNLDSGDGKMKVLIGFMTNCNTTDRIFRYIGDFKMGNIKPRQ